MYIGNHVWGKPSIDHVSGKSSANIRPSLFIKSDPIPVARCAE